MLPFLIFIIPIFFLCLSTANCFCAETPLSDAAVLAKMLTEAIETILNTSQHDFPAKKIIHIETGPVITLNPMAIDSIAALLTERRFALTDSGNGQKIHVAATDARVTVKKQRKSMRRTVTLTIHLNFYNCDGRLVFSGRRELNTNDTIPVIYENATDNSMLFSPDINRIEIRNDRKGLRFATLTGITGMLAWLAFY